MKELRKVYSQALLLTQFGLSLVMPLLLCVLGCWWLTDRFGVGLWIYIPGFILGIGGSATTAYKFYLSVTKEKNQDQKRVGFNRHR